MKLNLQELILKIGVMELTREQELLQTIIQKAWEDADFKQKLINDPINAIEKLSSVRIQVPQGKKIVVCDQTDASEIYINIQAPLNIDDLELNEEQLEIIAGGGNPGAVIQDSMNPLNKMSIIWD